MVLPRTVDRNWGSNSVAVTNTVGDNSRLPNPPAGTTDGINRSEHDGSPGPAQTATCKRDSRPRHGRSGGRAFGSSRHAHGDGGYRRGPLERLPSSQSRESPLVRPGPVRDFQRARVHVDLCAGAPERLPPGVGRTPAVPTARPANRRSPGTGARHRHRDHHRPAGAGAGQCGGYGPCGKGAGRDLQPAGRDDRRPLHVCLHGRRLPDGGDLSRSLFAGRYAGPGQADRRLRREQRLHRRHDRGLVHGRHAGAVSCVRLACGGGRRRARSRRRDRSACGCPGGDVPAVADLLQDAHRLGRSQQAGHGGYPRRTAGA